MCGIVGYDSWGRPEENADRLRDALHLLRHRGPDDEGITLIDTRSNQRVDLATDSTTEGVRLHHPPRDDRGFPHTLGLGHRRFALVDPGPQSHQPFWSRDGRLCVAWNGEIYNHVELRSELEGLGHRFSTSSDTEVLIEGYRAWGTECFTRFIGFWAVALFDAERPGMLLARDRLGKAPLYITSSEHGWCWASELGALRVLDHSRSWTVRDQSVVDFLHWGIRDIGDCTFFEEVMTFPAASFAWLGNEALEPVSYWSLPTERLGRRDLSPEEAAPMVRDTLIDAVRVRLRADVPVGVQVSGGLDSSSILALTAGLTDQVDAYTVSFPNPEANEEPYARAVAEMYGSTVDYHVLSPPLSDPLERLDSFVELMGEPFHSPNQLTNHAIWETIRSHRLRGVLYGAGGDEVFLGYPNQYGHAYLRWLLRKGRLVDGLSEFRHYPGRYSENTVKDVVIRALLTGGPLVENWIRGRTVPPEIDPCHDLRERIGASTPPSELEARQRSNVTDWLIPYWTRIDNQNSMGVPIELRCPFLDHRIVELGFRLPVDFFIRDGWTKWILRLALDHDLPENVAWRREKMGFPFPLSNWLDRSKTALLTALENHDCPLIDRPLLIRNYERLRTADPNYLWNVLSLGLWWRSSIE